MKTRAFSFVIAALITASSGFGIASQHGDPSVAAPLAATVFRDIAHRQNPAVVTIMTRSYGRGRNDHEDRVIRSFGLGPLLPDNRMERTLATGFLITAAGEILTNNHVVDGADTIEVTLFGDPRTRYRAVVVGRDPVTDTALIRLDNPPAGLSSVTLGDSSTLEAGDWVMAIGNPFELAHTVTVGVVSFGTRPLEIEEGHWQDLIQTDASINVGNSGGPLINVRGEVVGINVAILDTGTDSNLGIGFAVPINTVKPLLPQLRAGKVVRGHLGVDLHQGPILEDEAHVLGLPNAMGTIVMAVHRDSAAARAGLCAGDVIVEIDGHPIADARALVARVSAMTPGVSALVTVYRNSIPQTRIVTIEELPLETSDARTTRQPIADNGLALDDLTPSMVRRLLIAPAMHGALVVEVVPGSPADEAQLFVGDVIRSINRQPIHNAADATQELRRVAARRPVFLMVWREGTEVFLEMRPD